MGSHSFSLRSWRDFARECFCFACEAVNGSGEAVGGLVKSRVMKIVCFERLILKSLDSVFGNA